MIKKIKMQITIQIFKNAKKLIRKMQINKKSLCKKIIQSRVAPWMKKLLKLNHK